MLTPHPSGRYGFLPGIDPYSCGVVARPGWQIVRRVLASPVSWRAGFLEIERWFGECGLDRAALCAIELRSPRPFPMSGFIEFNRSYREVLVEWGLLLGPVNPIARTNVVPFADPPAEVSLHAFSYVRPAIGTGQPTFVVAGAGELRDAALVEAGIVRRGDLSPEGWREKCDHVLATMDERLRGLGATWNEVTRTNVYTVHPLDASLRDRLLARLGPAARRGIVWNITRPPVVDIEFEMDLLGLGPSRDE